MTRSRRVLPATLVALVLLVGAVLVAVSGVQVLLGQPPLLPFAAAATAGSALTAASPAVLVASGVLAALGLVLLLAAVLPGAPTVLPLVSDGEFDAGVTRRSLASSLTTAVRAVDGVDRARVRVRARRVDVTVHGPARREPVRIALEHRLAEIEPAVPPRVRVRSA